MKLRFAHEVQRIGYAEKGAEGKANNAVGSVNSLC